MEPALGLATLVVTIVYMLFAYAKANASGSESWDWAKAGPTFVMAFVFIGVSFVLGITVEAASQYVDTVLPVLPILVNQLFIWLKERSKNGKTPPADPAAPAPPA